MVSIYEVATEAHVSAKTAARILAGQEGRPYNRQRVLAAAAKLGYVRNQQAASLRSGKSGLLGLIVPDIRNPYYPVFFHAVHDAATDFGYQILLSNTFGRKAGEAQALAMLEMNRVEGVFLNVAEGESDEDCDRILRRFLSRRVPVIVAGRPLRTLAADQIVLKNQSGVEKAVSYLLKTGRRRVAFITGGRNAVAARERLEGYRTALAKNGATPGATLVSYGDFTSDSGYAQTVELLKQPQPPDAIMAANDLLASGALKACATLQRRVPQDIAIIGFDDIPLAQLCTPALTTLCQPTEKIARDCVNLLVERIKSGDLTDPKSLTYEPNLIIRDSA